MTRPPVVWVLLHDLGRTGAPIALSRLVRWLADTRPAAAEVHLISGRDGPLRSAFALATASVSAIEPSSGRRPATTAMLGATQAGYGDAAGRIHGRWIRHQVRHLPRPDVVLVQGAGAWPLFRSVEGAIGSARVVVHLHELGIAVSRSGLGPAERSFLDRADAVAAVSEPVADLARRRGARDVTLIPGTVSEPPGGWRAALPARRSRQVVSIGTSGWRKGTDLALAAAWELDHRNAGIGWHWIGEAEPSSRRFARGAPEPMVVHGASIAPWEVVPEAAALVVPSREDPLPLVALEAGARGVPVVATRTGGLGELLADRRGWSVAVGDLLGLVDAVTACLDDPDEAAARAGRLRERVRQTCATEAVGPTWLRWLTGAA